VRVSQAMVDQVVGNSGGPSIRGDRLTYQATMSDYVGKLPWPEGSGTFVETKKVTLIVQRVNCDEGQPSRNEVITMYPGWSRRDGP
jgi:hypothetical protein